MLKKLFDLINELIKKKFYGQLIIKFEAGNIVHLQKIENIKL